MTTSAAPRPHPAPGRRERKKSETREALRDAALRLALEHGYEQLTVEAVAAAADVSTRTFFNYFSSKDDALLAADPDRAEALARMLAERPAHEPPVAALRAVFLQLADDLARDQPLWEARRELVRAHPQLWPRAISGYAEFERSLARGVAARTGTDVDRDLYPGLVAGATVSALRVAVDQWRSADGVELPVLLGRAFDLLAAGLELPRGAGA